MNEVECKKPEPNPAWRRVAELDNEINCGILARVRTLRYALDEILDGVAVRSNEYSTRSIQDREAYLKNERIYLSAQVKIVIGECLLCEKHDEIRLLVWRDRGRVIAI